MGGIQKLFPPESNLNKKKREKNIEIITMHE